MSPKKSKVMNKVTVTHSKSLPTTFEITSGKAIWGQMQCVVEGINSESIDTSSGPAKGPGGGTILQSQFQFRTAALKGEWKADTVSIDDYHIGYVCWHVSQDPKDIVRRASRVGISHGQAHGDKKVVYVNRYDFSWHHGSAEDTMTKLGIDEDDDAGEDLAQQMMGGRFFFVDDTLAQSLVSQLARTKKNLNCGATTFSSAEEGGGVHLSLDDTEYEFAWLVFDDEDTLIGVVYDGAYAVFQNESSEAVAVLVGEEEATQLPGV